MSNSLNNPKSLAVIGVFGAALIAAYLYYEYGPGSGYRELQASQAALHEAKSWRAITKIPLDTSTSMVSHTREIVCPTDYVDSYAETGDLEKVHRRAYIHGFGYSQLPDGRWINSAGTSPKLNECGKGPIAGGGFLYWGLRQIEISGKVLRGERERTEHGSCVWFHIYTRPAETPDYSVCIEGFSHLPLEVRFPSSGDEYFYWDWNRTTLTPPVVTAVAAAP
jgi:hypothetical protein